MMKMIRVLIISCIILMLCVGGGWADNNTKAPKSTDDKKTVSTTGDDYAPDELLIKFTEPQTDEKLAKKVEKIYGKETKNVHKIEEDYSDLGLPNTYLIKMSPGEDPKIIKDKYKKDSDVVYAEPNYEITIDTLPNDPSFYRLWGLHNTGQTGGTPDADIDAPEAWDICTGSPDVVVAVVDTGVDYTHPDLSANIWVNTDEIPGNGIDDDHNGFIDDVRGWDFRNKDNNPMDDNNHGTHCAGTIGGTGANGIGVAGVNWNVRIMPLKFLSSSGSGYTSDAVSAILYANANGAHVISNSWGGSGYSQALKDAIDASPAVVACAAGNSGVNADVSPMYPAAFSSANIISVAATDYKDAKASFSNYGVNSVDVAAPGVSIYSTLRGGSYGYMSGTSMATPHVAGLAGLLKAGDPALSNLEIKNLILTNCDILPSLQGKILTSGRINAFKSLSSLQPAVFSLTAIAPSSGMNNSVVSASITGTGFSTITTVKMVGSETEIIATGVTVVTSNHLTCSFDLRGAPTGIYDVAVISGNGDTETLPSAFTIVAPPPPVPVITALSPSSAVAGGTGFTLTISGSNFTSACVAKWNGYSRSTILNAGTGQLQASIPATDIAAPGIATITVSDPDTGTSNGMTFTILPPPPPPVPVITALSPSSAVAGGTAFTLTISGSNFTSECVAKWNGNSRSTILNAGTGQLQASIPATDIAAPGTATITVSDPGTGTSNEMTFTIASPLPPPTVSRMYPNTGRKGTTKSVTIYGTNFMNGATAELRKTGYPSIGCNGVVYVTSGKLTCSVVIPSSAGSGYWDMTVYNPDGNSGTKAKAFYIY
jgi:subtilisin family serine protease